MRSASVAQTIEGELQLLTERREAFPSGKIVIGCHCLRERNFLPNRRRHETSDWTVIELLGIRQSGA